MKQDNIFSNIPESIPNEIFEEILSSERVRIERIITSGNNHSSGGGWYDQDEGEWVLVVQGEGVLEFEEGENVRLTVGDYVNIPAHKKHRVTWTDPDKETIWLAVFY
ncbi:MAG: cupin domain-containing protein [Porticoccus sp.]